MINGTHTLFNSTDADADRAERGPDRALSARASHRSRFEIMQHEESTCERK